MTTELQGEVVVPRFEDNLWRELARIHDEERSRTRPLRRPSVRRTLVGVVAAAAVVALVVGVVVTGTGPGNTPEPALADTILRSTQAALADSVVHQTMYWDPGGPSAFWHSWDDETSGAFRSRIYGDDGAPVKDFGVAPGIDPAAAEEVVMVDYCSSEYAYMAIPASGYNRAQLVVELLNDGSMIIDGPEVVDGRELIRMHERVAPESSWYIDPETYRPVMIVAEVGENNDRAYTMTIEYLPRTPENLGLLTTPIPPGFTQVDELRPQHDNSCD